MTTQKLLLLLGLGLFPLADVQALLPRPAFVIYGLALDEYGWPYLNNAEIILRAQGLEIQRQPITGLLAPDMNFRFYVPLDNGVGGAYATNAIPSGAAITLAVRAYGVEQPLPGAVTNTAGLPGDVLQWNVTAGLDIDHDGLPDPWEQWIVDHSTNANIRSIWDVHPGDDFDGDTAKNIEEYWSGTDPTWAFDFFYAEQLQATANKRLVITSLGVPGKTYRLYSAPTTLINNRCYDWQPCPFATTETGPINNSTLVGCGAYFKLYLEMTNAPHVFRLTVR